MLRTAAYLAGILLTSATALAGAPKLIRLTPAVATRGTSTEIELRGLYLQNARDILFYEPGVKVESIEPITEEVVNGKTVPVAEGTRLKAKLQVSNDCHLGPLGLRLLTAGGLSEYQRLFVTPFSIIQEIDDPRARNDEPANAQAITENATIVGTLRESYDIDLYKVFAKRGERVSAEIVAVRIGVERGLPDLHVAILDADGEVLVEADDSALFLQDPVVSFLSTADQDYFVAVRHSLHNANNDAYVLHVGSFPRPTALYPAGGQAGTEVSLKILGVPGGSKPYPLSVPAEVVRGLNKQKLGPSDPSQEISLELQDPDTKVFAPTPNTFRVSGFANELESEPNDTPEMISDRTAASIPVAFNGIIDKPGDVDCFKFTANKGQTLRIHAIGSGLGSAVDPMIWVKQASGKGGTNRSADSRINQHGLPSSNSIERVTVDPILLFNVPEDGEYVVGIEDERGEGGEAHVYRIECQTDAKASYVYIPPEPENRQMPQARQVINVPADGRYNTTLSVVNTNRAHEGELELVAVGLPKGVQMEAPRITPEMNRVPVVFTAQKGASMEPTFAEIFARPVAPGDESDSEPLISGFRQQVVMTSPNNNEFYLHIPVDRLAVAVTDPAPMELEVEEPRGALVQNGEMALRFKVKRRGDFSGPVTVMMEWKPIGINTVTPLTLVADEDEGEYLVSAARNAVAGNYLVTLTIVNGSYQMQYRDGNERTYACSKPFMLTVAEPHVDARFARDSVERGKTSVITVQLNHLKSFEGKAKAALMRLPRGVEVLEPYREITSSDKEVQFTLKASDDSLVGSYRGMTLEVSVEDNGQVVRQFTGSGTLRIDAQRGGKPAS